MNGVNALPVCEDSFLICRVCEGQYRRPKLLSCFHSFCNDCLETNLDRSQIGPGQAFLCPICKTRCIVPEKGVRDMTVNALVNAVVEFLQSKSENDECGGCHSRQRGLKKCIECSDWLCSDCCTLHMRVKMTKTHHLVSHDELQSGKYDSMIKETLESSLLCGKHGEPLRYFCDEPSCSVPVCHLCKMTELHDGHATIALEDQAASEAQHIQELMSSVEKCIRLTEAKIANLTQEEKMTGYLRKKMHKMIIDRTEEVINKLIKGVQDYAEGLHQCVEKLATEHRDAVLLESEEAKNRLEAAKSIREFSDTLVRFNRSEELLTLSEPVCARLIEFQVPVTTTPPSWKKPRLNEAIDVDAKTMERLFGTLTFEGDVIRSVMSKTFSVRSPDDERECKLCDVAVDGDSNIVIVDRENKIVRLFGDDGNLKMNTPAGSLKAPNRVSILRKTRRILVRDDKLLKLFSFSGIQTGVFGDQLKQPVALAETEEGEVMVTEWMGGEVIVFDENGKRVRSFPCSCEAPGYVASSANGNIILSDWKQHVIKAFDRRGRLTWSFGRHGNGDGRLDHPYGVCTDRFNNVIVCDTWNNKIHLLSPEGHFVKTLLASAEGIEWPQAIAVDRDGRLVIAEQGGLVKIYEYMT